MQQDTVMVQVPVEAPTRFTDLPEEVQWKVVQACTPRSKVLLFQCCTQLRDLVLRYQRGIRISNVIREDHAFNHRLLKGTAALKRALTSAAATNRQHVEFSITDNWQTLKWESIQSRLQEHINLSQLSLLHIDSFTMPSITLDSTPTLLPNLASLTLTRVRFTDNMLATVHAMENLQHLGLHQCYVLGDVQPVTCNNNGPLPNLRSLAVHEQRTPLFPVLIISLPAAQLTHLEYSCSPPYNDAALGHMKGMTRLKSIKLGQLTDKLMAAIITLPALQHVHLMHGAHLQQDYTSAKDCKWQVVVEVSTLSDYWLTNMQRLPGSSHHITYSEPQGILFPVQIDCQIPDSLASETGQLLNRIVWPPERCLMKVRHGHSAAAARIMSHVDRLHVSYQETDPHWLTLCQAVTQEAQQRVVVIQVSNKAPTGSLPVLFKIPTPSFVTPEDEVIIVAGPQPVSSSNEADLISLEHDEQYKKTSAILDLVSLYTELYKWGLQGSNVHTAAVQGYKEQMRYRFYSRFSPDRGSSVMCKLLRLWSTIKTKDATCQLDVLAALKDCFKPHTCKDV